MSDFVQFAPPNGIAAVKAAYGDYNYTELSGGNIAADPAWVHDNLIVLHNVCGLGKSIQLHHKVAQSFLYCLSEAVKVCPSYQIRMLGGFCARHQRHDARLPLSIHSWGAAFDVNWDTNHLGPHLITDIPLKWIEAFTSQGWEWGGGWHGIKDAMHFQFATGC